MPIKRIKTLYGVRFAIDKTMESKDKNFLEDFIAAARAKRKKPKPAKKEEEDQEPSEGDVDGNKADDSSRPMQKGSIITGNRISELYFARDCVECDDEDALRHLEQNDPIVMTCGICNGTIGVAVRGISRKPLEYDDTYTCPFCKNILTQPSLIDVMIEPLSKYKVDRSQLLADIEIALDDLQKPVKYVLVMSYDKVTQMEIDLRSMGI